jgi:hypothetical protein
MVGRMSQMCGSMGHRVKHFAIPFRLKGKNNLALHEQTMCVGSGWAGKTGKLRLPARAVTLLYRS